MSHALPLGVGREVVRVLNTGQHGSGPTSGSRTVAVYIVKYLALILHRVLYHIIQHHHFRRLRSAEVVLLSIYYSIYTTQYILLTEDRRRVFSYN